MITLLNNPFVVGACAMGTAVLVFWLSWEMGALLRWLWRESRSDEDDPDMPEAA